MPWNIRRVRTEPAVAAKDEPGTGNRGQEAGRIMMCHTAESNRACSVDGWSHRFLTTALAVLLAVFTAGCSKSDSTPPGAPKAGEYASAEHVEEGIIAAVGDSLTAGFGLSEDQAYPALLEQQLHDQGYRYRVVNAGISGETSSGTLERIQWVLTLKPDIVILETGANDGLRGVNPALTERNIDETVRLLDKSGVIVVLAGMRMSRNLGEPFVAAFEAMYPSVARRRGVILIPFLLEGVAGNRALNLPDSIHPNAEGYRIVAETVLPYAVEAIRQRKAAFATDR